MGLERRTSLRPLFDSEEFEFIGSADAELIVNCRKCREEAHVTIDVEKMRLLATCTRCCTGTQFKFREVALAKSALPC